RGAETVSGCALRTGDRRLAGVLLAERELEHLRLGSVADGGRRCVRVDVVDLVLADACITKRHVERAHWTGGVRLRDVFRIRREPVAGDLGVDLRAARARMFELL